MDMMLEQFKTIFDRPEKVKRLRETILDLAVRGKLVKQDPNDEPASVLIERIKEEKERLVKEGKIKREKQLPEIREDEKPFELPNGWVWVRISELGNIFNGNSINTKLKESVYTNVEEGYNYISTKDVAFDGRKIEYNTGIKVPYKEGKFKVAHHGAVLICSEGGSAGRKIGLTDRDICFGNKLYAIEPYKGVLSEYIFYIYQSTIFFSSFASKMTGIIGGISTANFKEISIPLCSMKEQERIIKKVHSLMIFCDKLEKALEKKVHYGELSAKSVFNAVGNVSTAKELEEILRFILLNFKDLSLGDNAVKELKNCILQLAVQGKLVPQDPSDESAEVLLEKIKEEKERLIKVGKIKRKKPLGEIREEEKPCTIPKGWKFIRLDKILISTDAGKSPSCNNRIARQDEYGVIKTTAIQINKFLSYENKVLPETFVISDDYKINKNDVLITRAGPKNRVGIVCCVESDTHNLILSDKTVRFRMSESLINHKYVCYALNSSLFRKFIEDKMTGMAMSQVNISQSNMRYFILPFPPLNEQNRIVEKVNSLMSLCDELEKKIEKQKGYSNRLMESILKDSFKV